jgi:hypothetical protein
VAQSLVRRQDAEAGVLEQDGQLQEEVREGVELGDGNANLSLAALAPFSLTQGIAGMVSTLMNLVMSAGKMVSMCRPLPYTTAEGQLAAFPPSDDNAHN